jgi:hypothetical protein
MKKLLASDPAYPVYNDLWNLFAIAKNPQVFFGDVDMEPFEIQELLEVLEDYMQALLEGLPFEFAEAMVQINTRY